MSGLLVLIKTLNEDSNESVRGAAACALGRFFEEQKAIEALKQAQLYEKSPVVRYWISKALEGDFFSAKQNDFSKMELIDPNPENQRETKSRTDTCLQNRKIHRL